jgi:hypothetical protein
LLDGFGMRAISAVFLACLIGFQVLAATAADAQTSDADIGVLTIDAGRLVTMVDRGADAIKLLAPAAKDEDSVSEPAQNSFIFPELVYVVRRYNIILAEACRASVVDHRLCGDPYRPAWINDAPDSSHSILEVRAMIDDTTAHLEPFWSDICAKAKHAAKDEAFCQIE